MTDVAPAPNASVLTGQWAQLEAQEEEPDEQFILRQVAISLARTHQVHTMVASGAGGGRFPDGALWIDRYQAPPARQRAAAVLERAAAALAHSKKPPGPGFTDHANASTRALRFPPSHAAAQAVVDQAPEVLVVTPSGQPTLRLAEQYLGDTDIYLLLATSGHWGAESGIDPQLAPRYQAILVADDLGGLTSDRQGRNGSDPSASDIEADGSVVGLGLPISIHHRDNSGVTSPLGHALDANEPYVVVLAAWPSHRAPLWPQILGNSLISGLESVTLVFVGSTSMTLWRNGKVRMRFAPPTRKQLWSLLAGARALVDVRQPSLVARETMEAMLSSVPVVVAAGGAGAAHVRRANAGLWYEDAAELTEAVRMLAENSGLATQLGANGLAYAETVCREPEQFAASLAEAVGTSPKPNEPTGP